MPACECSDFSECQLAAIPPEISALTRLQRLDLHSNKIGALPPSISALQRLDHLSLHRQGLAFGSRGVTPASVRKPCLCLPACWAHSRRPAVPPPPCLQQRPGSAAAGDWGVHCADVAVAGARRPLRARTLLAWTMPAAAYEPHRLPALPTPNRTPTSCGCCRPPSARCAAWCACRCTSMSWSTCRRSWATWTSWRRSGDGRGRARGAAGQVGQVGWGMRGLPGACLPPPHHPPPCCCCLFIRAAACTATSCPRCRRSWAA